MTVLCSYYMLLVISFNIVYADSNKFHETLDVLRPATSPEEQAQAAWEVINRTLPAHAHKFKVTVDLGAGPIGRDTFKIFHDNASDVVVITGTSGVAAARGFNTYLRDFCGCHVSWDGSQLAIPEVLPNANITITSSDRFRYYQNVCTWSYTFAWWGWDQWRRHLDWMALNGINLALAPAQEAAWVTVYRQLGLTQDEIDSYMAGPAFLAWQRMGNLNGWAGPLSTSWLTRAKILQRQIMRGMQSLGMTAALPAFAGHTPKAFTRLFPNASLTRASRWNDFPDEYSDIYFLDPSDPLFGTVSAMFLAEITREFQTNHAYFCDPYNELSPSSGNLEYVANISRNIYNSMRDFDPEAVWLVQGWMFVYDVFWTPDRIKAFLTAVPIGGMLVLDLQAEQHPQYGKTESFYGQPYIWCLLSNFGGTLGLLGSVENVNYGIPSARKQAQSTMVGVGLTMEGINQNYPLYELALDMAWTEESLQTDRWFRNYAARRYGGDEVHAAEAWELLRISVYSFNGTESMRGKYTFNRSPRLNIKPWYWYETSNVLASWKALLQSTDTLQNSPLYRHDLVDITRQNLQQISDQLYLSIVQAFRNKQADSLKALIYKFLELLDDLDIILLSHDDFLLGNWIEQAKATAENDLEREQYEYNARNQITLWGPDGQINDYANKQWSGIVSDYFRPRWLLFLNALLESVVSGKNFDEKFVRDQIFQNVEKPFTYDRKLYPTKSKGDTVKISQMLFDRWSNNKLSLPALPVTQPKMYSRYIKAQHIKFSDLFSGNEDLQTYAEPHVVLT